MPFDLPDQLNNVGPEQQSQALWIGLYVPKSRGDAPPDKYIAPIMISATRELDTERDQSFTEAVAVCESVRQWYARWGYQLVEVPKGIVEERMDFILRTIQAALIR